MYVKQPVGEELLKAWGLDYSTWADGSWGNLIGGFKLYRSLTNIYTKMVDNTDVNGKVIGQVEVTDIERTCNEIILLYLEDLIAAVPQLRIFLFRDLPEHMQYHLRNVVRKGIQTGLTDRNILQRRTSVEVTGSGINMNATPQEMLTTLNWFGDRALASLVLSGIMDMDIIGYDDAAILTKNGNKQFLAKFDETKIKDLNP